MIPSERRGDRRASPRSTRPRSRAKSAPVIRESGGDRSAVTGGTQVISDWIRVRITAAQGSTFIDRMIKLVEGAERQKTPNEICAQYSARRSHHHLRIRHRDHSELCDLCGRRGVGGHPGRTVRDPPSRPRSARFCPPSVSPAWTVWSVSMCWRCRAAPSRAAGDRRHAAARQDRHHHARQPASDRVQAAARGERAGIGGRGATRLARRRDARRPFHRGAREGEIRHSRPRPRRAEGQFHPVLGPDPDSGVRGPAAPWGAQRLRSMSILTFLNPMPVAIGSTVRALQPAVSLEISREIQAISDSIAKSGGTRLPSPRTAGSWVSSTSRTSSRAVSASASTSFAAWAFAPS